MKKIITILFVTLLATNLFAKTSLSRTFDRLEETTLNCEYSDCIEDSGYLYNNYIVKCTEDTCIMKIVGTVTDIYFKASVVGTPDDYFVKATNKGKEVLRIYVTPESQKVVYPNDPEVTQLSCTIF